MDILCYRSVIMWKMYVLKLWDSQGVSCCVKGRGSISIWKSIRLGWIFSFVLILVSDLCFLVFPNCINVLLKGFKLYIIYVLIKHLYHSSRWIKVKRIVIVIFVKFLLQTEMLYSKISCSSGRNILFNFFSLQLIMLSRNMLTSLSTIF